MILAVLTAAATLWQLSPFGGGLRGMIAGGDAVTHASLMLRAARGFLMFLVPGSITATIVVLVLVVLVMPYMERRLGSMRFVTALIACHLMAVVTTMGFASFIADQWPRWSHALFQGWSHGALPALLGASMAASGGFNHLWRVRTRWVGLAITLTFGFYDASTVAALTLGAMITGLALGAIWWRGAQHFDLWPRFHERRVLVSLLIACASLGPLLAAWSTRAAGPMEEIAGYVRTGQLGSRQVQAICRLASSHACSLAHLHQNLGWPVLAMSVLPALVMLVLCLGLVRARRSAWFGALIVGSATAITTAAATVVRVQLEFNWHRSHPISQMSFALRLVVALLPAVVPVGVVILLLFTAPMFRLRLPRPLALRQLTYYALLFVSACLIYVALGLSLASQWSPRATMPALFHDVVARMFGFEVFFSMEPSLSPLTGASEALSYLCGPVITALGLVLLANSMRLDPRELPPADAQRLRGLIRRFGGGVFAWMTQWQGVRHWYDPSLQGVVGYRRTGGVALALGEPIGEAPMTTALNFARRVDEEGLTCCFYSVGADFTRQARELGWRALQIAEESRITLGDVAFKGKRFQDLRTAMNRAKREGIDVVWTRLDECSVESRREIREVVEGWQRQQALPPLGFTLGGFAEMEDPEVRTELAVDEQGRIHGVASWLPVYRDDAVVGWLLDVMRRREGAPDVFHSAIELLIAKAILQFQDEGCQTVSLSGSPLATEPHDDPSLVDPVSDTVAQGLGTMSGFLEKYYGFTSLHHFKAKFGPEFHPLYLVYADPIDLPKIGRALTTSYITTEPTLRISRIVKYIRNKRDSHTSIDDRP